MRDLHAVMFLLLDTAYADMGMYLRDYVYVFVEKTC